MVDGGELKKEYERKVEALTQSKFRSYKKLEDVESVYHFSRVGKYLGDLVFGANDGIITTFAVVAGAVGASLSPVVIIILGFANLFADGISMGVGNYLGNKSEREYQTRQREKEGWEVDNFPEIEREEIREILRKMGFENSDLDTAVEVISKNKKVWVEFMMRYELGIVVDEDESPVANGFATFVSFFIAGLIPLLPFLLPFAKTVAFPLSVVSTGTALFAVGALRSLVYPKSWLRGGLEVFLVGSLAASVAYATGFLLEKLISNII